MKGKERLRNYYRLEESRKHSVKITKYNTWSRLDIGPERERKIYDIFEQLIKLKYNL